MRIVADCDDISLKVRDIEIQKDIPVIFIIPQAVCGRTVLVIEVFDPVIPPRFTQKLRAALPRAGRFACSRAT